MADARNPGAPVDLSLQPPLQGSVRNPGLAPDAVKTPQSKSGDWFTVNAPPTMPGGQLTESFSGSAPSGGGGYGGWFTAPNLNETNDPGYRFRLDEQQRAFTNSAFSRGQGLTGGALRDLTRIQGGLASQEYQNVFNRQLAGDQFNRDTSFGNTDRALNQYMASRDTFWGDSDRLFNRNFSMATLGQNAALGYGTNLGQFGQSGSGIYQGIGNSQSAGTIGMGNAISSGIGSGTNNYLYLQQLRALQGQGGGGG